MIHEFHLSPRESGRGVSCDADGAFIGAVPLLKRLRRKGKDAWQPRSCDDISDAIGEHYGLPIDMSSKRSGLTAIANALNEGDVARAQIAAVLLGIPDPPQLAKSAAPREATIKLIRDLHWSGLLKWNPDEHPRWPAGSSDGRGGEFAPKGEGGKTATSQTFPPGAADRTNSYNTEPDARRRNTRIQLADAGISDASDDPVAEAVRAAAAMPADTTRNPDASSRDAKPVADRHENWWQALGSKLSHEAESALSQIGQTELAESNASLAAAAAEAHAVAEGYNAYSQWMDHPIGGEVPITPEYPIWGYGPNAQLAPMRPITRGDAVGAAAGLLSILPVGGTASAAARLSELAAPESEAFIALPSELPENFNNGWPIGRYTIPADAVPGTTTYGDLVGDQIGKLVQSRLPGVPIILRTSPGMKGVDIELLPENARISGFRFGEIKPLTGSGFRSFNTQVGRWKLPGPVHAFTYDYKGNIYYGFPFPWQR